MPVRGKGRFNPDQDDHTYIDSTASSFSRKGAGAHGTTGRIREYRALKRQVNTDGALELLRRVGRTVRPIMLKYGFRLPLLSEFLPKNPNLLGINVNRGQRISLRLRWDSSPQELIDEEQVTLVMLHELTHNLVGPHNDEFYRFLDKITQEYYEAKRSGRCEGEGFLAPGRKLGGASAVDESHSRRRAAETAEERRRKAITQSPARLGGTTTSRKTPRELAAEAAERRRQDAQSCPSTQVEIDLIAAETEEQEKINGIQVIAVEDDEEEDRQRQPLDEDNNNDDDDVIFAGIRSARTTNQSGSDEKVNLGDFTHHQPEKSKPPAKTRETIVIESSDSEPEVVGQTPAPKRPSKPRSQTGHSRLQHRAAAALSYRNEQSPSTALSSVRRWPCQACTFSNSPEALSCEICSTARPGSRSAAPSSATVPPRRGSTQPGWQCSGCGFKMVDGAAAFWMCSQCGAIKASSRPGESGSGVMSGGGDF